VPTWLAILVLVLLLLVVLAAGFVIRGLLTRDQRVTSPQEIEIRTWTGRVAVNPNDPAAHLGLGYAYQTDGRYDKALEQYEIVLKANPRDTAALYNRGNVYFKIGVDDRAEKSMWAVLDVDPTHPLAAKALGDYYAGKNEFKSLIVAVKPAAEAHPELADLQYLLGLANEKLGDNAAAARYYQLAIRYAPDLVKAREGLKRVGAGQ
jgi:tetratricopeptide (TPR) repeat protein